MSNSYVSAGNTFRVYGSDVQTHDSLPPATYRVGFHPMAGFSLERTTDLQVGGEKVYGNHATRVKRVARAYQTLNGARSLGVMLSGDKGMGKSLMLRMLAEMALHELKLPVILVDINVDGIAEFIDSLGEALVVFDEFEKTFPDEDADGMNAQHKFLGLFDGMSSTSRIYALSVNELEDVSSYLLNRPGRFHYHMRFDYPGPDEVRQYLRDQAPAAPAVEVEEVVAFSRKVSLNYDHLRAIAFEIGTLGEPFSDVIGDLNIKRVCPTRYAVTASFSDGTVMRGTPQLDLFADEQVPLHVSCLAGYASLGINSSDVVSAGEGLTVSPELVEIRHAEFPNGSSTENADAGIPKVTALRMHLVGSEDVGFSQAVTFSEW